MQAYMRVVGALIVIASGGAWGAESERGSLQDAHPACRERHSSVPEQHCVIRDRLPPSQYARRYGSAVVLIEPSLFAPLERQTTNGGNGTAPAPPRR